MGRELALAFPEALDCFERADRVLREHYEEPLSRYIFPPPSFTEEEREASPGAADRYPRRPGRRSARPSWPTCASCGRSASSRR